MKRSNVYVTPTGRLLFDRTMKDAYYAERITGGITGLIEFENEPEFCNDHRIYLEQDEEYED